jgi:hypothetical protein
MTLPHSQPSKLAGTLERCAMSTTRYAVCPLMQEGAGIFMHGHATRLAAWCSAGSIEASLPQSSPRLICGSICRTCACGGNQAHRCHGHWARKMGTDNYGRLPHGSNNESSCSAPVQLGAGKCALLWCTRPAGSCAHAPACKAHQPPSQAFRRCFKLHSSCIPPSGSILVSSCAQGLPWARRGWDACHMRRPAST